MSAATLDDLHLWVDKMMTSLQIPDYKLDIGGNTTKGDGYLGEVTFLKVETSGKTYDLVIKSAKKSDELRKQTPIKEAYDREIFFYSKIFPLLDEFQRQRGVQKAFSNVPKCFSVSSELTREAVILQNLKSDGFELHDRKQAMNLDHVLMVFRNYGKYHALSLGLKEKKPAVFNSLGRNLNDLFGLFITKADLIGVYRKEFEHVKTLLEPEILQKFDGLEEDFERILVGLSDENTEPSVLLHGDCWNNNFMFKYEGEDKSKPTEMSFLDFQLVRVGSPVIDLSYFLYCCADAKVLQNFDFILQAYHSSFCDFLADLGCDAEALFPFKKLKEHWREFGKYGLVQSLFLLKISLCDSSEAPDLMETAEKGEDFKDSFQIKMQNLDVYNRRIKDVFEHFAHKFL
ncbi:hypothetical protein TcasGA2_TC009652 [Tribolium castaneum]|uniref:CHK kinase-like domain-containing protein n=1 Tax=Tribolium castaneum TaxID=7070 RepID=D6WTG7_TRICA|nr:PREDICTED: uncharacterized protein LOC103313592 [Tribolium castaneum]EFA06721.1 hypothetical protein TcasGA2_TC009652 [Tribolium castaneum]|eukprot:XP_008195473.1 PREDICTED: uncharacterized protein LOC103313592 [Tribolium castaneum]